MQEQLLSRRESYDLISCTLLLYILVWSTLVVRDGRALSVSSLRSEESLGVWLEEGLRMEPG